MPELKPRPSLAQDFVGRQDILDAMRLTHMEDRLTNLQTPAITVLHGLGGSGKTQIALKFAQDLEKRYPDKRVFFLNASSEDSLKTDLETIIRSSEKTQPSGSYGDALTWLATRFNDWLLILDNADDPSVRIFQYIPRCTHGDVIITTRNSTHASLARRSNHSVEGLSVENAIELLLAISGYEDVEANREMAHQVVTRLGGMPLAAAQAGGYIFVNKCLSSYLNMYEKNQADLLKSEEIELPYNYTFTVATTVKMSLEKLPAEAQELLRLFAHLDYTSIADDIITRSASRELRSVVRTNEADIDPQTLELSTALMKIFGSSGEWSEFAFRKRITQCLQYSLLRVTTQGDAKFYSMHVLVQSYIRTQRDHIGGHRPSLLAIRLLGSSISDSKPYEYLAINRHLTSHVQLVQPDEVIEPGDHLGFGQVLEDVGDSRRSIIHREKCVEMWNLSRGEEHKDTLNAKRCLARSYSRAGNYRKAMDIEENLLKIHQRLDGLEHPDTLEMMHRLASSYYQIGRRREALNLWKEVLQLQKRVLGPEHPDILSSMNAVARSYNAVGQLQEALKLWEEVFELREHVLGSEHPDTLISMNNLAISYKQSNRLQEALKLEEEVLELRNRVLGPEHPDTLISKSNLAVSYYKSNRLQEALELEEEVLELRKRVLGPEHPDTLTIMGNLAVSYRQSDRLQEALKLREEVLELRKRVLGLDHPDTLMSMRHLADSYDAAGQSHEAMELREAASALQSAASKSE